MATPFHEFDLVVYHGCVCVIEQAWETDDERHTAYCTARPVDVDNGVYIVEQSEVRPYYRTDYGPTPGPCDLIESEAA